MITRRKFLKKSAGVVAAVIAGPAVLSAIPGKVEAKQLTESEMLDNWGPYIGITRKPHESDDKFRIRLLNKRRMASER